MILHIGPCSPNGSILDFWTLFWFCGGRGVCAFEEKILFWLVNKLDHGASITQQICVALKCGKEIFGLGILELTDFDIDAYGWNSACRQFEFHDRHRPPNLNPTVNTRSRHEIKFGNRLILMRESVVIQRYSLATEVNNRMENCILIWYVFCFVLFSLFFFISKKLENVTVLSQALSN